MSVAISKKPPAPRRRTSKHAATPALKRVDFAPPADKRFIFIGEVLERLGNISALCLGRWIRDGKFPPAYEVGGQRAWIEESVDRWMQTRPVHDINKRGRGKRS